MISHPRLPHLRCLPLTINHQPLTYRIQEAHNRFGLVISVAQVDINWMVPRIRSECGDSMRHLDEDCDVGASPDAGCVVDPEPYTLHPTPYTPHPTPYTLHPKPSTQNVGASPDAGCVVDPEPYTLHPTPYTFHPTLYAPGRGVCGRPWTLNPQPSTLNPQPSTLNPQP